MITTKTYFNPNGEEILDEKISYGEPTGFIDFNRPRFDWSKKIYDQMIAQTWFPAQINVANEKKQFSQLSENEQNIYKYVFAQLSFNDSIQSFYLADIQQQTNNNLIRATLIRQSFEEVNHSNSYAFLLDSCGNSDEVFDLYKTDDLLKEKNEAIAEQFAMYINKANTKDGLLLSSMASVNLEGIYFLLGFGYIFTLGDKIQGGRDMIVEIAKDEINCFTDGTEVLTDCGFVDFSDITFNHKIANYTESGGIFFKEPSGIINKNHDGEVLNFKQGNIDIDVTPEHRMVRLNRRQNELQIKKADKISYKNHNIPVAGYTLVDGQEITTLDRLAIAIQADGHIVRQKKSIRIRFCFTKKRKLKRLKIMLNELNISYSESIINVTPNIENKDGKMFKIVFTKIDALNIDKDFNWIKIDSISSKYCFDFLHELKFWDGLYKGREKNKSSFVYTNTNRQAIDKVIAIATICGVRTSEHIMKRTSEKHKDRHVVNFIFKDMVSCREIKKTSRHYKGKVYCVSVDTGMIIVRRNDKIAVSGNCHLPLFANIYKTIQRENKFSSKIIDKSYKMLQEAVDIELKYGLELLKRYPILGLREEDMINTIYNYANERCIALGLKKIFNESKTTELQTLINRNITEKNSVKTNFFEGNVKNYAKGHIDLDDF